MDNTLWRQISHIIEYETEHYDNAYYSCANRIIKLFEQSLSNIKPLGDDDDEELLLPWLGRGDPEAFRQIAQADRDYVIDQIEGMLK